MYAETYIQKHANALVPPKFETHLNKLATKTFEVWLDWPLL